MTDLMVSPGIINLDFADVRAVMNEMGKAMMGTGEAEGEDRAIQAAEKAIANPLLDEISLKGAKGVLINITGGSDLTLFELDEAANRIREEVDQDANIIVGSTMDEGMGGLMRVSVVATGIDANENAGETPVPRRSLKQPLPQQTIAPAPQPEPVPAPAPQPVAARQAEQYEEEEPSLFERLETERAAAREQMEDIFEEPQPAPQPAPAPRRAPVQQADDDLPPPAYQPQVAAFNPQPDTIEADPNDFVAPRAPAPGTPSPDALARLKAAAAKSRDDAPKGRNVPQPQPEADKPRFSVNSLIGRMTGHGQAAPEAQQPARRQPPVQGQRPAQAPQAEAEPEDDRIEIPAFLRRQAN